jgi:TRAP-type C4-dicarboxylate transport system substrate-binding protein
LCVGGSISGFIPALNIVGIPFSFDSNEKALAACEGELGDYVRREIRAKGLEVFHTILDFGMREITNSTRPVRAPDDLAGLKIRTQASKINIEFFKTFGTSAVPVSSPETFTALQTHVVDGVESPLGLIDAWKWASVQRYLSLTHHIWTNLYLFANVQAAGALPPEIRASLERNGLKYLRMQWRDMAAINASLVDKLRREGLIVNGVASAPFRRELGAAYRSWKSDFGSAWALLEKYAGKLA